MEGGDKIGKLRLCYRSETDAPSEAMIKLGTLSDYLHARSQNEKFSELDYWITYRNNFHAPEMVVYYDLVSALTGERLLMKVCWESIARFSQEQHFNGVLWYQWESLTVTESHLVDEDGKIQEYYLQSGPGSRNYGVYALNVEQMEQDATAVRIAGLEEKGEPGNFGKDRYAQSRLVHRVVPNSCLKFLPKGSISTLHSMTSKAPREDMRLHRSAEVHSDYSYSLILNSQLKLTIFNGVFKQFVVVYSEDLVQHLHDIVCEANGVCPPVQSNNFETFLYQVDHPDEEATYTPDSTVTHIHLAVLNILQKHCPVNDFGVTSKMMRVMELVQIAEPLSKLFDFQRNHSELSPREALSKAQESGLI